VNGADVAQIDTTNEHEPRCQHQPQHSPNSTCPCGLHCSPPGRTDRRTLAHSVDGSTDAVEIGARIAQSRLEPQRLPKVFCGLLHPTLSFEGNPEIIVRDGETGADFQCLS